MSGSSVSNLTVHSSCTISSNGATSSGGFAVLTAGSSIAQVSLGGKFSAHTAGLHGGLFSIMDGSKVDLLLMQPGMRASGCSAAAQGGLVYVGPTGSMGRMRVESATILTSAASTSGGILSVAVGGRMDALEVTGSTLESNSARTGGCVSIDGQISRVSIKASGAIRGPLMRIDAYLGGVVIQ